MRSFSIAVKAFIINDKGEILSIKRRPNDVHSAGTWDLPGGRLDSELESPFDGLNREVMEEVGLKVNILNSLAVQHFVRDDNQKITMLIFLCKALTDNVELSDEHVDFKWSNLETAKEFQVHHFHSVIDVYKKFFADKI